MANEVFSELDLQRMEQSLSYRARLLENFAKVKDEDLPTKPAMLMAVVNLAESIDRTIITRAKVASDAEANNGDKETANILRDLMKQMHMSMPNLSQEPTRAEAPSFQPTGMPVGEGETIKGKDTATL